MAIWAYLLERAKTNGDPGRFGTVDLEDMMLVIDLPEIQISAVLAAMESKGLLASGLIRNWSKRQHKTSTERVQKFREKRRERGDANGNDETNETVSETQRNGETRQTDRQTYKESTTIVVDENAKNPLPDARKEKPLNGHRKPRTKTTIGHDWKPDIAGEMFARDRGLTPSEFAAEALRCRDYHLSKGDESADWAASWRTWVLNFVKFAAQNSGRSAKQPRIGEL